MSDIYGDYDSVTGAEEGGLPSGLRRAAGAAVFLGLVVAMGLWAYRLGTRDATEVPVIRAMEGPVRVQPEDPGGEQAAHQGLEVNAVLAGRPAEAPRSVEPAPPPIALADEDAPQAELEVAARAAFPPDAEEGAPVELRVPDEGGPEAPAAEADPPPALLTPDGEATPDAEAEPEALDAEVPAAAGPRPRSRPSGLAARAAPPASPAAAVAPAPATAPAAEPVASRPAAQPREVTGLPQGARLIQLGAYDSEAVVRQAWDLLLRNHGDLLGSKSLYVERATANARVFYRLRVAGFGTAEETRAMCEALRARGVDCIPVKLQ